MSFILIVSLTLVLSCKVEETPEPEDHSIQFDGSDIPLNFTKFESLPNQMGADYNDIYFSTDGWGALIYNSNRLYVTKNNGQTWQMAEWTPEYGFPLNCVAVRDGGIELFVGSTSGGSQYPGKYKILNGNGDSILYEGAVSLYNTGNPNFSFVQASYSWDGGLFTAMGNSLKDDGNLLVKYSNTLSLWHDMDPFPGKRNYVSAIVRKQNGMYAGIFEILDSYGNQGTKAIYQYSNGEWFNIDKYATSFAPLYEYPLSLDASNENNVVAAYGGVYSNNKLYFSTTGGGLWRKIAYTGISANLRSAKFDAQSFIWVCTDDGLYKSTAPLK